ncbi:GNAT family N-acetyltransferase [Roseicyclus sp. F158]|uniref:GNAT family N-acetyltransferase n=1 Tax=Tropicimonas omnivorans TaxID=3075590 RepID=A0ABU3DC59_9RHOB|nr:GNAT family N-acetyltransferase [Roseicyclus sp. F158]MDT0681288.1 GNAT family N-acetyltransferase [Roseicyclus sp. F158]
MSVEIVEATEEADLEACFAVRHEVFIGEQKVTIEQDRDGRDGEAMHFLAREDGRPVGAMRVRIVGDAGKLERVCVLKERRGTGAGAAMTRAALAKLRSTPGIVRVILGAQVPAIPFYERLGFTAHGEIYDDSGIAHRSMALEL